tara:strand:+ start:734 stop:1525 length:792 start_codon:yes stop_codon:yes gene_type:complete
MKANPTKGYVIVATKRKSYLQCGSNLAESILDNYPEAKITLFTQQDFIDNYSEYFKPFDKVLPTPSDTNREKMYGMWKTPYDHTFYIDADCEVVHPDIKNVFDHLDGHDMAWVNLTKDGAKVFAEWNWGPNLYDDGWRGVPDHLAHCGGVCLYDASNPLVREFMKDWYELYFKQRDGMWNPKEFDSIKKGNFRQWDQLTIWWLIYHSPKYKNIKWKFFEDNYRWNYFSSFGFNPNGSHNLNTVDPVVIHYSAWLDKFGKKGYL